MVLHLAPWKLHSLRISPCSSLIYLRPSRISEPHGSCYLIEGLARRIIMGPSYKLKASIIPDYDKMSVASAYHKTYIRRLKILMGYIIGSYMPSYMVYAHQRLI